MNYNIGARKLADSDEPLQVYREDAVTKVYIQWKPVPVRGLHAKEVAKDPKFLDWVKGIDYRFQVREIRVLSATFSSNGLLFAKLSCDVRGPEGELIPGIVFLRGKAVAILVILKDKETGTRWTVLTQQPRFPVGAYEFLEIPAGMIDQDTDGLVGKAFQELQEETGLMIDRTGLKPLGSYCSSAGGVDEEVILFVAEFEMTRDEIDALRGRETGVEGERITLRIVPLAQLCQVASKDPKASIAYLRYTQSIGM